MKPIPGYTGYYASKDGHIWSSYSKKFLSESLNTSGYLMVNVKYQNRQKYASIHRLMGLTYLHLTENDVIHHKNNIKTKNNLENLEVTSLQRNTQLAVKDGLTYIVNKIPIKLSRNGYADKYFDSETDAQLFLGYRKTKANVLV